MSDKRILLGILLLALTLWIIGLGNLPLRDWDEGTYAMVAREIYRTGNWFCFIPRYKEILFYSNLP